KKHEAGDYRFQHFTQTEGASFSLRDDNIVGISEDEDQGLLWIVTQRGAVHYVHLESFSEQPQFYRLNKNRLRDYNPIYAVEQYAPRKYWVASAHGFANLSLQEDELKIQAVDYFPTEQGDNLFTGQSSSIINGNSSGLQKDRFGDYWVGTFSGIARIRVVDGKAVFDNYQHEPGQPGSLSNNSFRCFHLDAKGRLWVGTRSGLNLVVQKSREDRASFRAYGSTDGLLNDVIHAIEEDNQGYLWISTNRGLVHFNPDATTGSPKVIQTYSKANGLPHNSFIFRSSARSQAGRLYFGSTEGIGVFHPDSLQFNPHPPRLRFTQLMVMNEEVKPDATADAILSKSITSAKQFTLRYWQNLVTLRFAALNFRHPERNRYQYQFSALGDQWIDLGQQNQVSFTNVPSGSHQLRVRGSNNDGVWQEDPISLQIVMLPPPWRTWWAYLLYALSLFGLLYFAFRYRLDRRVAAIQAKMEVENARLETRQRVRDRNAADFHDELGHRLTKILLFTELAERENKAPSVNAHLRKIKSVATGLSAGIRDLIWSLDTQQDTLFATVVRLKEFGDQLFEYTDTHFRTEGISETLLEVPLSPEVRKHTLLLFKEAMNNALKYARADQAKLSVRSDQTGIYLSFEDDGIGFSPASHPQGYGMGNMAKRAEKMDATFDLKSVPGAGTSIQLQLKQHPGARNTPK
ncbi:MAG: two-component regulator propeller domain-containing protein, partial [Bacteroidota bacterium]